MFEYRSVKKEAVYEMVEKKSRFICSVKPVYTENQALEFIKKISDIHKNATHNVFAYVVEDVNQIERASDDGEPQGTAGIPVLEVVKKEGLKNICVVVTRYFGGILLGAGGLIRAYSSSAKKGISQAEICTMALYNKLSVKISYTYLGKVKNVITNMGNTIMNTEYTDMVKLYVKVKYDNVDRLTKEIVNITNGEVEIEITERFFDIS